MPIDATKPCYPRKADIVRAFEAARACGLPIGGVEFHRDGTIRILASPKGATAKDDDFDLWDGAGRL